MSQHSSRIKTEHLGVPHGTAQSKLRNLIIFHQAARLGDDVCFKCGQKIESADEMSIEHKIPWLHGDLSLFLDMENIAFSHCQCNRPDRLLGKKPQPAPEGRAWCVDCQSFLDVAQFYKSRSTWNGLQKYCRVCHQEKQKRYLARHAQLAQADAATTGENRV